MHQDAIPIEVLSKKAKTFEGCQKIGVRADKGGMNVVFVMRKYLLFSGRKAGGMLKNTC